MKEEIEMALSPLLGLPLSAMHRSRKMTGWERFEFGPQQVSSFAVNGSLTCGLYIIHTVCGWRIVSTQGIAIGAFDYSSENGEERWPDFTDGGDSARNIRAAAFFQRVRQEDLFVQEIVADNIGSVHLLLANGYSLDLLPIDSLPDVQWRFMDRQGEEDDFVLTGEGIERTKE